jgi:hypothetical protein
VEVVLRRPSTNFMASWSPRDWLCWSSAVGVVSAVLLSVCVNLIATRFDRRLDATSDHRYTLSIATRETVTALTEPVSVYVFLSRADPIASTVKQVVDGYLLLSRRLTLRWIDPDRDPGQFLALQSELGMAAGTSKDGKSVSDSVIVLERGKRRSFLSTDDIVQIDADSGEAEPKLEQALTRGLRRLADNTRPIVCFTQGHRELSLQDNGADGLSDLKTRLERDSADVRTVDLGAGQQSTLENCHLVVVASPEIPLSPWAQRQVSNYVRRRGSLWVLSGTIPDESGRVRATGLDALLPDTGVFVGTNIVVEMDESQRLPDGFGESFFAHAVDHAATRSLSRGTLERSLRVLVSLAPSLNIAPGSGAQVLLASSKQSIAVGDLGSYLGKSTSASGAPGSTRAGEHTVAVAIELGTNPGGIKRRLIVAPASIVHNRAQRLPALVGNRAFVDGALTWLLARAIGVEIATTHRTTLQLALSDSDLNHLTIYVLLVMPGAVLVLGLALALTRYQRTRRLPRSQP